VDGDGLLNMSELEHFVEDIDSMEENMDGAGVFLMMYDADKDGYLSWDEYMSMWNSAEDGHDEHEEEYQLAILFPDNSSMMLENDHMENNSGWDMTNMTLQENNISVNYSVDATYGTMLTGINGFDAPADYSWWWSLYLWNETSESWDESQVGIDSVVMGQDAEHIAWAPSSANVSMLPVPEEHHDEDELMEEMMMAMLRMVFNESDMDGDGLLNESELEHFLGDMDEEDHHPVGYVTIHVKAEGDYGFALPMDVEFHILDNDGGHDDHAGHDDHSDEEGDHDDHDDHGDDDHADEEGDHDDHADEEGDHDDHADEEGDHDDHADEEGALDYDPHSWLSPLAFKAQVNVVLDGLNTAFPAGEAVFKVNAEAYAAQLTALDVAFDTAFGEDGVCMAGGYQKTVAANHNAYSYIAVEYGIQFMTVHGLDPEGEPSPEDVAKVVNFIKEEGITVLFVEEYTDQSSVQSIVDETGVSIQILYTMEMAPSDSGDNYMTMMTKNLDNLIAGMGCM
jgi:ABC-type Zn uptake system ZnuABC Zn-binding protein ZnuA/Ca2+-binding EF-hand superfamily protein